MKLAALIHGLNLPLLGLTLSTSAPNIGSLIASHRRATKNNVATAPSAIPTSSVKKIAKNEITNI